MALSISKAEEPPVFGEAEGEALLRDPKVEADDVAAGAVVAGGRV